MITPRQFSVRRLQAFLADEQAATATEYAVMLAMMLMVALGAVTTYGQSLNNLFGSIGTTLFAA